MSEAQSDHAETIVQPLGDDLSILNCTKVVRIFVVDEAAGRTMEKIRASESMTRADVFAVQVKDDTGSAQSSSRSGRHLKPMSIGLKAIVDHHDAHHQHSGGIVKLKRKEGDQIEWQCDVPFRVVNITKATYGHGLEFLNVGNAPPYPFDGSVNNLRPGDRSTPIRSGAIRQHEHGLWKQLYKAHFELQIGGVWMPFDPDFYCDAH